MSGSTKTEICGRTTCLQEIPDRASKHVHKIFPVAWFSCSCKGNYMHGNTDTLDGPCCHVHQCHHDMSRNYILTAMMTIRMLSPPPYIPYATHLSPYPRGALQYLLYPLSPHLAYLYLPRSPSILALTLSITHAPHTV